MLVATASHVTKHPAPANKTDWCWYTRVIPITFGEHKREALNSEPRLLSARSSFEFFIGPAIHEAVLLPLRFTYILTSRFPAFEKFNEFPPNLLMPVPYHPARK